MHIGVICPPAIGHLNPMCALAHELNRRGNKTTFLVLPDIVPLIESSGLDCRVFGEEAFPVGSLGPITRRLGQLTGLTGLRFTRTYLDRLMVVMFRHLPDKIRSEGFEAPVIDQASPCGTIADHFGIPFLTVCNALPLDREDSVPPYYTLWRYRDNVAARLRNRLANSAYVRLVLRTFINSIQKQRAAWSLPQYSDFKDSRMRGLGVICQIPEELDFPRKELPDNFHYVGPLQNPLKDEPISFKCPPFPFEKLNGKPLLYASLGTLQNKVWDIFRKIAAACEGLDAQLVISLGDSESLELPSNFPGAPIVVKYAPHQQIIDRAALVITHAGMNTVLGALSSGVPMVAIPITNEQPGIAVRLARTGAGEVLPVSKLTIDRLKKLITRVCTIQSYRDNALRMSEAIRRAGGVGRAADIVLKALVTRKPVLRDCERSRSWPAVDSFNRA